MNKFRWFLIRLLIGKDVVVANAHIKGELLIPTQLQSWVYGSLFEPATSPNDDLEEWAAIYRPCAKHSYE